jgi:hypothetical protein
LKNTEIKNNIEKNIPKETYAVILLLYPIRGAYKRELEEKILALHAEKEE